MPHIPVWDKSTREEAPSHAPPSHSTMSATSMSVLRTSYLRPQAVSVPTMFCATLRLSATARSAPSSRSVVRKRLHGRSRAISMRMLAITPAL
jgi:hypothetical protein